MKVQLLLLAGFLTGTAVKAQKVDNIFFNLYTDSLKKGTYNYINVDGHFTDGRWLPLTAKEISFTTTTGRFENNSLFIDKDSGPEKVTVKAVLKADTSISKSVTIYVKKIEDNEKLKTREEVMREMEQRGKEKKSKG